MGHDGAHHPPASRDARKKRQGNRSSAKLKQCKLDARRQQWLSQVKDGKEAATATAPPTVPGSKAGSGSPILASPHPPLPRRQGDSRSRGGAPEEDAGAAGQDIGGSSDFDSPMPSPGSDNSRGCAQRKRCSSNGGGGPSLSSVSSLWSSSRSVSDAEDDDTGSGPDEENGVLDDWEAVADALSVDDDNSHCHQSVGAMTAPAAPRNSAPPANAAKRTEPVRSNARAWKPDDMFRPQSLPSISKQASFPTGIGSCWGMRTGAAHQSALPSPASCPICYEDLDPTDSSFLPCPCGFHLCLFCHKRIIEADGRCPGCRKQYNAVPAAGGGGGGATAPVRISRSCSMGPRR